MPMRARSIRSSALSGPISQSSRASFIGRLRWRNRSPTAPIRSVTIRLKLRTCRTALGSISLTVVRYLPEVNLLESAAACWRITVVAIGPKRTKLSVDSPADYAEDYGLRGFTSRLSFMCCVEYGCFLRIDEKLFLCPIRVLVLHDGNQFIGTGSRPSGRLKVVQVLLHQD